MLVDFSNWINSLVAAIIAALLAAIGFLIRKVLTNDTRINMLETEIKQREVYRIERDEFINDQLETIQSDIKRLIGKMTTDYRDDK